MGKALAADVGIEVKFKRFESEHLPSCNGYSKTLPIAGSECLVCRAWRDTLTDTEKTKSLMRDGVSKKEIEHVLEKVKARLRKFAYHC